VDECYQVVARFCARIFQEEPGAVYVVNASRTAIERIAAWGSAESTGRVYAPNACWALRRGRLHRAGGERLGPDCAHVGSPEDGEYLCIPMMGQGEALGIVHVRQPAIPSAVQTELGPMIAEFRLRTVIAVSEHIALALTNLRLRETLRMQAIRDPLTDLFNRRYMEESLRREIARAVHARGSVAAIMIDIDHFKRFNDTFGHPAADLALRETCSLISASGRGDEIACRWGGEEFVLILPDANLNDAKARAEELRQSISNHQVRYNGTLLGVVTASFGVAEFPSHAKTGEDLIRAADEALYEAKASGRNCVRCKCSVSISPKRGASGMSTDVPPRSGPS
jgi:diguanylate cyclase (GGDEF)-like protein